MHTSNLSNLGDRQPDEDVTLPIFTWTGLEVAGRVKGFFWVGKAVEVIQGFVEAHLFIMREQGSPTLHQALMLTIDLPSNL